MSFKKQEFCDEPQIDKKWNSDFIDSLMLFYQYNEAVIKYKIITGNSKNYKNKRGIRDVRHS